MILIHTDSAFGPRRALQTGGYVLTVVTVMPCGLTDVWIIAAICSFGLKADTTRDAQYCRHITAISRYWLQN